MTSNYGKLIAGVGIEGSVLTPAQVYNFNWEALVNTLVNAGLSIYNARQIAKSQEAAARAAAAAGQSYQFPGSFSNRVDYMPFVIGGLALIALMLFLRK